MSLFSAISKWFNPGKTQEILDVIDPVKESTCACGGQCTCGDSSQREPVATASVTGEDSRVMTDILKEVQEEVTAVVDVVVEEAEKVAEVVVDEVEEVTELTEEVIAAADEAAAKMLEDAKTSTPTTENSTVVASKPQIKRKRKPSRKSRKKK